MECRSEKRQSKSQQARKRRNTLYKKLLEYYLKCGADFYLALRVKKTGQIHTVRSISTENWPPSPQQLVCFVAPEKIELPTYKFRDLLYPVPVQREIRRSNAKVQQM